MAMSDLLTAYDGTERLIAYEAFCTGFKRPSFRRAFATGAISFGYSCILEKYHFPHKNERLRYRPWLGNIDVYVRTIFLLAGKL